MCYFTFYTKITSIKVCFSKTLLHQRTGPYCSYHWSSHNCHVGIIDGRKLKSTNMGWPFVSWCLYQVWKSISWIKSWRRTDVSVGGWASGLNH